MLSFSLHCAWPKVNWPLWIMARARGSDMMDGRAFGEGDGRSVWSLSLTWFRDYL